VRPVVRRVQPPPPFQKKRQQARQPESARTARSSTSREGVQVCHAPCLAPAGATLSSQCRKDEMAYSVVSSYASSAPAAIDAAAALVSCSRSSVRRHPPAVATPQPAPAQCQARLSALHVAQATCSAQQSSAV